MIGGGDIIEGGEGNVVGGRLGRGHVIGGGDIIEGGEGNVVWGGEGNVVVGEGVYFVGEGGENVVEGGGGDFVEGGDMTVRECKVVEVMELVELPQVLVEVDQSIFVVLNIIYTTSKRLSLGAGLAKSLLSCRLMAYFFISVIQFFHGSQIPK